MYNEYFPRCEVKGDIMPAVPYGHMVSRGAVPNKCAECKMLFEGECVRGGNGYLRLDHGPCGEPGQTDPVFVDNPFYVSKVTVPRKCTTCSHLGFDAIHRFFCGKDRRVWGDFHRGLDWGTWMPKRGHVTLPAPKITTEEMIKSVIGNSKKEFFRLYRLSNKGSLQDAVQDFIYLRAGLDGG